MTLWTRARSGPRWVFQLLNNLDQPLRDISHAVRGGSVALAFFDRLGGSAQVELSDRGDSIDFMNHRLAISYDPGIAGLDPWPVGVYTFASPRFGKVAAGARRWSVNVYPKLDIIDTDSYTQTYSVAGGANIINTVVSIIQSTGETRISAVPSAATLTSQQVFSAGTSKLTIINELLTSAGYRSLWADGSGQFRVEPYVEPENRPVIRTFTSDQFSIHKPEWSRMQELSNVPNRVVVVSEGTDDVPGIVGVAENTDPNSQFSIPSRNGRVITRREEVSDIANLAAANELAQRYLRGGMAPVANLSVTHAIVPLDPGNAIEFNPLDEAPRRATVTRMEMTLDDFSQCNATWREVTQ